MKKVVWSMGVIYAALVACSNEVNPELENIVGVNSAEVIATPDQLSKEDESVQYVLPTLDPYCDYNPDFVLPSDAEGGERVAIGAVDGKSALAITHYMDGYCGTTWALTVQIQENCIFVDYGAFLGDDDIEVTWVEIIDDTIVVDTLVMGDNDSDGESTIKTKRVFRIANDELIEEGAQALDEISLAETYQGSITAENFHIDTQGLYESWQLLEVESSEYPSLDLPDHIQVRFTTSTNADIAEDEPIIFIIPLDDYMSGEAPNHVLFTSALEEIEKVSTELHNPIEEAGVLPTLPHGWPGEEDIYNVEYLKNEVADCYHEPNASFFTGVRQIGRFVATDDLYYVFQGFSNDGKFFLSFYHPMSASYRPSMNKLDKIVTSIRVDGMPVSGIMNNTWYWVGGQGTAFLLQDVETAEKFEIPQSVEEPERYTVEFTDGGLMTIVAEHTKVVKAFAVDRGGNNGELDLGGLTLFFNEDETLRKIFQWMMEYGLSGKYRVRPGGDFLELYLMNDSYLLFSKRLP